jgi:hypothetical protein
MLISELLAALSSFADAAQVHAIARSGTGVPRGALKRGARYAAPN